MEKQPVGTSVGFCEDSRVLLAIHIDGTATYAELTTEAARSLATSLMIFADLQEFARTALAKKEQ